MNIPLPPSDNLYKFIGISGLVLVVTGVIADAIMMDELERTRSVGWSVLDAKSEYAKGRLQQARAYSPILSPDSSSESGKKTAAVADARVQEAKEQLDRVEKTGAELNEMFASIKREKRWSRILSLALYGGTVLMLIGFALWYWMLQRHQDKLIRLQLSKSESKEP